MTSHKQTNIDTLMSLELEIWAPDEVCIFISKMPFSSPNPMFDHLLESSFQDDSNKWSNIGFGEEIMQVVLIEGNFMHLIWSSELYKILTLPKIITTLYVPSDRDCRGTFD